MNTALSQIESNVMLLTADEQLTLISRIAERLSKSKETVSDFGAEMIEMAADPEIQHELREIDRDFRITEMDGLTK